jgi:hypothetical protein
MTWSLRFPMVARLATVLRWRAHVSSGEISDVVESKWDPPKFAPDLPTPYELLRWVEWHL